MTSNSNRSTHEAAGLGSHERWQTYKQVQAERPVGSERAGGVGRAFPHSQAAVLAWHLQRNDIPEVGLRIGQGRSRAQRISEAPWSSSPPLRSGATCAMMSEVMRPATTMLIATMKWIPKDSVCTRGRRTAAIVSAVLDRRSKLGAGSTLRGRGCEGRQAHGQRAAKAQEPWRARRAA